MADDPNRDLIPMKDVEESHVSHSAQYTESVEYFGFDKLSVLEKKVADQLSRSDLEDQLFRLKDENHLLKIAARKQEDKLKKLSTRMSRLLNEKKKLELNASPGRKRDIEMEEAIEELQDKVRSLEKNNVQLREKLLVAKQQVITQARRPNPYGHVPPKVNSGHVMKAIVSPYAVSIGTRAVNDHSPQKKDSSPVPPYVMQLLDEARIEIFNQRETIALQSNKIEVYEQEIEILKERLRIKDNDFQDEVNALKSQITERKRHHVQENLDLIELHRELSKKNSKLITLQAQNVEAEEKLKAQRVAYDRIVKEFEDKSLNLRDEQQKNLEIFSELQKSKAALLNLSELRESLKSLRKENEILKDTNDKLIKSVLSEDKVKPDNSLELSLTEQIRRLEGSLSSELKEKEALQQQVKIEQERYQELKQQHDKLENDFEEAKVEKSELESKVNILKSEEVDFEELGEALALIKLKKGSSLPINFTETTPQEDVENLKTKLKKSETDHAETLKELVSIREMLMTQYKLNKVAQEEVLSVTEKYEQQKREVETKYAEYAHQLDIRASKIQKLERQLNDIAYGTKKFKIEDMEAENIDETIELDHGENVFEIHIMKFLYNSDGIKFLQNNNPSSFMTWNFYEFDLQSTPVVASPKPIFGCSAQYTVKIDDFFLFYLQRNTTTLELHESFGSDYRTLAACQLGFSEILDQPHGRLHGTEQLIGVCDNAKGLVFGTVHYWVRLRVPMEEAFNLYKQKFKALSYIQSNNLATSTAAKVLKQPSERDSNVNDLNIKIIRCLNLQSRHEAVQPSPFCVYKFYDLPDQETITIPASSNPEFSDHHTFPVFMDFDFDKYLKTQSLEVYIFDESDPDLSSYIGKASISLLPLSQNKPVTGVFELLKDDKESCGSVEVSIYWQHPYVTSSVTLPKHLEEPIEYPAHIAPVLPVSSDSDEPAEEHMNPLVITKPPVNVPVPKPRRRTLPVKPPKASGTESSSTGSTPEKGKSIPSSSSRILPSAMPQPAVRQSKVPQSSTNDAITEDPVHYSLSEGESPQKSPQKMPKSTSQALLHKSNEIEDEDTMLERKQEISFEEISDEDKQALSELSESSESEQEARKQMVKESRCTSSPDTVPTMIIRISQLTLKPGATVLNDPNIRMLYVEYKFLDYAPEELETPYSMPKPIPPDVLQFDYKKEFPFHPTENLDQLKKLAEMFYSSIPGSSWIKFTIVSEPPDDEEESECEDMGYAFVDLQEIFQKRSDMLEESVIVYDAKDNSTEIGKLVLTVQAMRVLRLLNDPGLY